MGVTVTELWADFLVTLSLMWLVSAMNVRVSFLVSVPDFYVEWASYHGIAEISLRMQWRIQDFPDLFCQIFPKTIWKWKKLDWMCMFLAYPPGSAKGMGGIYVAGHCNRSDKTTQKLTNKSIYQYLWYQLSLIVTIMCKTFQLTFGKSSQKVRNWFGIKCWTNSLIWHGFPPPHVTVWVYNIFVV